jgi:hypothetical protein
LDGLGMKNILLSSLAEFFAAIGLQKAHWYRLFEPGEGEVNSSLINATFPSLAFLMKMDHDFVQQMLVQAGLARKKLLKKSYSVYADCNAWESLIAKHHLNL